MILLLSNKVSCFIYKVWVQYFIPPDYETAWFVDFYDTRKFLFLKNMTREFPKDQEPKEKN